MTVRELREKYLAFFESKGHKRFPSGSLIPYDVTGRLDESLLFNGAGMVQFKPYFRGVATPEHPRLTTAQKCVRTGDIEEVGDATHLTFFEMLGNFSFGDYFKSEAVSYSWEFLTGSKWLKLDPRRLAFTVFEEDDEAYQLWAKYLTKAGIDPSTRVFRLGEETNYWPAGAFSKGPPGPCGPNSEMFYWVPQNEAPPSGAYSQEDYLRDEADGKWVEIWNDVFIQYEWQGELRDSSNPKAGYEKLGMPELPFRSIDTGMGLERTALVLGGYKTVYDTDVFAPIFLKLAELRPKAGPGHKPLKSLNQEPSARIVADHLRTASFCIADGVLPANNGRGYVLRRLIRRAVLQGQRALGFDQAFLHEVFGGLLFSMGDAYPQLEERKDLIAETLRNEEELFRRTLKRGVAYFAESLQELAAASAISGWVAEGEQSDFASFGTLIAAQLPSKTYPGRQAFDLYDTFGFPLEVTQELASEAGLVVDTNAYEEALREAQDRSRGSQDRESVYGGVTTNEEVSTPDAPSATEFLGYNSTLATARVVRLKLKGDRVLVALDQTPFYAESGGQTGDTGTLVLADGRAISIDETTKASGIFWHRTDSLDSQPFRDTSLEAAQQMLLGQQVEARVDQERRNRIRRHHTATHLLHAALRKILGTHVTQAGSYVGPENLRFDFTHGKALTQEELSEVERLINDQALANEPVVTHVDLPISEARARGAMALFGEKYGDKVRMVEIGEFSRELCGGIHVRTASEVGLIRITSESSAASGVRRIEAVAGEAAYELVKDEQSKLREAAQLLKAAPKDLLAAVEKTIEQLKEERKRREKAETAALRGESGGSAPIVEIGPVRLWVRNFGETDAKLANQELDNAVALDPGLVGILATVREGKIQFAGKAGAEALANGAHVGNILKEAARIAGGGGGGRADFATAGGRDADKVDEALASAQSTLATQVGQS